ncbi:hypothetical protein [Pleomorphovibrio marinus]|uniref:hypothetical protein n=1 Tax=Pleomorphovibrio marinus TaxID=2164132 RepID=UPI000E0AACBD|nr:hypothetical protein [Pleomorphovibrio marinus]
MKKLTYIFIVSLFVSLGVQAQEFPSQVWHNGKVFLENGEVFEGKVKYDLENNVVNVQDQTIKTFNAVSIHHFEIFDEYYGGVRVFYSLPYAMNSDYKVPIFFELLVEGEEMTLLCREFITVDNRGMNHMGMRGMHMGPMWGAPMMGFNRLAFEYYFLADQEIQKYSQKKRELFDLMDDKSSEVRLYMRKNRLSHDRRGDLTRITAYYNQLKQDT